MNDDDSDNYYDNDDEGFYGYIETTVDPGHTVLIATCVFCVLSQLLLPCFVILGGRYGRRNRTLEAADEATQIAAAAPHHSKSHHSSPRRPHGGYGSSSRPKGSATGSNERSDDGEEAAEEDRLDPLSPPPRPIPPNATMTETTTEEKDEQPYQYPDVVSGFAEYLVSNLCRAESSVSARSAASTATTFLDAGIGQRRKGAVHFPRRLNKAVEREGNAEKWARSNAIVPHPRARHPPDVAIYSGDDGIEMACFKLGDVTSSPSRLKQRGQAMSQSLHNRAGLNDGHDSKSSASLIAQTVDDISPGDAADALDPGKDSEYLRVKGLDDDEDLDLCCGTRACWRPAVLGKALDSFLDLIEFDRESRRIVKLAIPFTVSEVMEELFGLIGLALVSLHLGTDVVAAWAVTDALLEITCEFAGGFIDAESALCSHAIGTGNNLLAGQYIQLCAFGYVVINIPFVILWSIVMYDALIWLGMSPEIAQMGQDYARIAVFADIVEGLCEAFHGILEVSDKEAYSSIIGIIEGAVEVGLVAVAVIFFDVDLVDLTLIEISNMILFMIFNISYTYWRGWLRPYWKGMFHTIALKNRPALTNVFRTGLPLALGAVVAEGEWEVLTIFAAALGPAEVTAWAILGDIWDTFEASTEGIGDAGEVRCAYHLGKGNAHMARISSYKSIIVAVMLSSLITSLFFIMGDDLPTWFTHDPTLQHMLSELLPLVGVGNMTMAFGMVCWALVGAQGRYRLATLVAFTASWFITIPLAAISVYWLNLDLQGLTSAVCIGYSACGTALSYVLIRSDWERLSRIVQEINVITGEVDSSDSDSSHSDSSASRSSSSSSEDSDDESGAGTTSSSSSLPSSSPSSSDSK